MTDNASTHPLTPTDHTKVRERARALARADRELRSQLVALRRIRGVTQQEVADIMDVSVKMVAKLERYDFDPRMSTLRTYANAIGVTFEHVILLPAPEGEPSVS